LTKDYTGDQFASGSRPLIGESGDDYRQRQAILQAEAQRRREQEIGEQRSPDNSAGDRIRIWERRHQLPLPRSATHNLLTNIAEDTGLSLAEIQAEQEARALARASAPKP
jgi:hypothetical protein